MSKTLFLRNETLEAKGVIPEGMAAAVTYAAVLERGTRAFYEGFYGKDLGQAISAAKAEQGTLDINDSIIDDIRPMLDAYKRGGFLATHTTSDFPLALMNLRTRSIIGEYTGQPSTWREWVSRTRTTPDFRQIRTIQFDQMPELRLRPEGADVEYATFGESEDGYSVANFELAVKYTWEMWLADDLGAFDIAMRSLGRAARRTEALVILRAIDAGVARSAATGIITGAPTIEAVAAARQALARREFTDSDGNPVPFGYRATDILFGGTEEDAVYVTLNQRTIDGNEAGAPNTNRGLRPHVEPLWNRVLGTDWLLFDRETDWLEVAFLEGFQGGPRTYTQLPDVREYPSQGSFANHSLAVKVGHNLGAKVLDDSGVVRVEGE